MDNLWDFDFESGHAIHPAGVEALIVPAGSKDVVSILGPFEQGETKPFECDRKRSLILADLVQLIESTYQGTLVVFGGFLPKVLPGIGVPLDVFGERVSWIPALSMRSSVIRVAEKAHLIANEWKLDGKCVEHRLGLRFTIVGDVAGTTLLPVNVDSVGFPTPGLFSFFTIDSELNSLALEGVRLLEVLEPGRRIKINSASRSGVFSGLSAKGVP